MTEPATPPLSSLLVKPASWDCNLRCHYCFYLKTERMYPDKRHRMTPDVLERMTRDYQAVGGGAINYGWQGGEPLLMGRDFFHTAFRFQERHRQEGQFVANSVQTNGILIDEAWARLFANNRCLIGVSLDGPARFHNHFRGPGTHGRVLEAITLMRRLNVQFNVLTVLNSRNVTMGVELYRYLRGLDIQWMQFIPIIEPDETGAATEFSVFPEAYGEFLLSVFEEWRRNDVGRISVRMFDSMVLHAGGRTGLLCLHDGRCDAYLVVEHNGDVYPCDFFVKPEWKAGNLLDFPVAENAFLNLLDGEVVRRFREGRHVAECEGCEYLETCRGGCQKDRLVKAGGLGGGLEHKSPFCSAYREFNSKTLPYFQRLARELNLMRDKSPQQPKPSG